MSLRFLGKQSIIRIYRDLQGAAFMETKIDELAKRIYSEGVEKGEAEAKKIKDEAIKEKEKMLTDARQQAREIVDNAHRQADELKRNIQSEIKLSGQQAINSVRQSILNLVTSKILDESTEKALSKPETITEFIKLFLTNWKPGANSIELVLPAAKKAELDTAIKAALKGVFSGELTVNFSESFDGGFQIGPKDGSFKISLTTEDFIEFFKEYLRPKTREIIFNS